MMRLHSEMIFLVLCMMLIPGVPGVAHAEQDTGLGDSFSGISGMVPMGWNILTLWEPRDPSMCYLTGWVMNRSNERNLKTGIGGVTVTLKGDKIAYATTDSSGFYSFSGKCSSLLFRLPPPPPLDMFTVTAMHPEYEPFQSTLLARGFPNRVLNISLQKRAVTTVLLVRHADVPYGNYCPGSGSSCSSDNTPQGNPPDCLNPAGEIRANELVHVVNKSGVTAIYRTVTDRGYQTVHHVATALGIQSIHTYDGLFPEDFQQSLVPSILENHRGEVVLVQGHSNTLENITKAFGGGDRGNNCTVSSLCEYDNLCMITVYGEGKAKVVNLQYGARSPCPPCVD